ncbi:MAG: FliI/YscN family ATPase [Candidatus Wallbacteria bacterium]|nr:FliI/YscN family ATPase [Candidatus Wallbacteria bacterium]
MRASRWNRARRAASPAAGSALAGQPIRINWGALASSLGSCPIDRPLGRVDEVVGSLVKAVGPKVRIGEMCELIPSDERPGVSVRAEVVAFRDGKALLMPYGDLRGLGPGSLVAPTGSLHSVKVGERLLGRVIGGLGEPLDEGGDVAFDGHYPLYAAPPEPLRRTAIDTVLPLGVRALDGLLTCGRGQRIGIFSGSGVGKSTLLGMIARNTAADVNVIALIGERGCEVKKFIDQSLGPAGLARSVVIVVPSSAPAMLRTRAAFKAMAIAEYFRDRGGHVLLMMDSLTRFAWALRDVGLAAGEAATARGFTPSVFSVLPQLLERSGTSLQGSITGLFTVLVEGDDLNEPVSDTVRGLLDGHVILSRSLAQKGWFPAIDVPASVSRLMKDIVGPQQQLRANRIRSMLTAHAEVEDLVNMGEYRRGANPDADLALERFGELRGFLQQDVGEQARWDDTRSRLDQVTR